MSSSDSDHKITVNRIKLATELNMIKKSAEQKKELIHSYLENFISLYKYGKQNGAILEEDFQNEISAGVETLEKMMQEANIFENLTQQTIGNFSKFIQDNPLSKEKQKQNVRPTPTKILKRGESLPKVDEQLEQKSDDLTNV